MRSFLVVTLFTVAEALSPEDTVVGDHHSEGMEHIRKYGDYSKYMTTYSGGGNSGSYGDYQKYMDEYNGNNSHSEDYKDKYEKKYGHWEAYKKKYSDWHKYEKEGERYKKKYQEKYADEWTTTVNAVPATVNAVHTTPVPHEEATAEANITNGTSLEAATMLAEFGVSNATEPDSKGMEHIQKYGDYSKYLTTYSGGGSSGSYGDYQKYMDEYNGNNSNFEDYKDKYEKKYADWEAYKKKYSDWQKYKKEGERYKKKYQEKYADEWTTTVNAVPATVNAVHTTPVPHEEATAEANTTNGTSLEAPTMLAEFGVSNATEPHSKGVEHIQKYGDYSKYMTTYSGGGSSGSYGDYQKYMDKYNGNNSNFEDYKDKYEKKYGDWEAYKKKYSDWQKYEKEGERYKKKYQEKYADEWTTTVNAVPATVNAVHTTPVPHEEATAEANTTNGTSLEAPTMLAEFGVSNATEPHSKGVEHIQKYGDYSKYMTTYSSGGSSGSYGDYQKYMDEHNGDNSNSEDYKDKYEKKYGDWEAYKKKYGDWHKYEKEGEMYKKKYQEKYADKWNTTVNAVPATVDAVQRTPVIPEDGTVSVVQSTGPSEDASVDAVQPTPASSQQAAALVSLAGQERSPWLLALCAFASSSIPLAFLAARRRQQLESCEEESTRFLLMV